MKQKIKDQIKAILESNEFNIKYGEIKFLVRDGKVYQVLVSNSVLIKESNNNETFKSP